MAGHNKWSKVKHIKGAVDAKRGRLFSKLAREIAISAKEGGGDAGLNSRLRQAVASAKAQNMPNDTIERAVKKGSGELEGVSYEEIMYEGYVPGGVAFLVETATDNRNRTAAEMRSLFSKNNGSLGSAGSVSYLFDHRGEIRILLAECGEERMLEYALDSGVEDVSSDADHHILLTNQQQLAAAAENLRNLGMAIVSQKLVYLPQTTVMLEDSEAAARILRIFEQLDDCEDTINVFSNFDIPDDLLEQLSA